MRPLSGFSKIKLDSCFNPADGGENKRFTSSQNDGLSFKLIISDQTLIKKMIFCLYILMGNHLAVFLNSFLLLRG